MQAMAKQVDRGFHSVRSVGSTRFERKLFEAINGLGFAVAVNGTEHSYPEFVSALHRSHDQTSLAIRFQPDAVASIGNIPRSFYVEAKAAVSVEKLAYQQYMKLHEVGNIVTVVFEKAGWRWTFVEELELIDGDVSVAPFPIGRRFPVDNEGWICPRRCAWWNQIKQRNPQASGTPFKYIDRSTLRSWGTFKVELVKRLTSRIHQTSEVANND